MTRMLLPTSPVRHVIRATTPPQSPRGYHVAIITRCLIALLFASGCVSTPAYEQVSSAVEVERESHRRTHAALMEKEAKLKALESQGEPFRADPIEAPKSAQLVCPENREKELTTVARAREAELMVERKRTRELDREKAALARLVTEKEAELRALRASASAHETPARFAPPSEEEERKEATNPPSQEDDDAFVVDPNVPDPLPSKRASVELP